MGGCEHHNMNNPTPRVLNSIRLFLRVPPSPTVPDADVWTAGPSMSQARCGLGVTAMPDGNVYAVGGYGGDLKYLSSAEVRTRFIGYFHFLFEGFCKMHLPATRNHAMMYLSLFLHAIFLFMLLTCFAFACYGGLVPIFMFYSPCSCLCSHLSWAGFSNPAFFCFFPALPFSVFVFTSFSSITGTIVNGTYGIRKNYFFKHFYLQNLVLLTMVPRNSFMSFHRLIYTRYIIYIYIYIPFVVML